MSLATEQGKVHALEQLRLRREKFQGIPDFDNSAPPAGSPMYYRCVTCGDPTGVTVPESWTSRPDKCRECQALVDLGWME